MTKAFAELHCHTDFSFLDGASPADDLVERALELGLSALAVTDHQGLYGAVRFSAAAREAGLHAVMGMEVELLDTAAPDPDRVVLPPGDRHDVLRHHHLDQRQGSRSGRSSSGSVCPATASLVARTCAGSGPESWART